MKYILTLFCSLFCSILAILAQNYEPQGTTVKKQGCDVMLILQVSLQNDSTGDVAKIQAALDECFSLTCDLPCANGKTGRCKIITKAVVVAWNSLSATDKPKFHHVNMLSGQGVSSVNEVGVPNSGKSSGGSWYRQEYSPKVYCHETMHLAGLKDHYRDCRPNRLALGVDNCKDGDTCTAAQIGTTPACKGYENDLMGTDVTKPVDCNMDIVEVIRIANDPLNPAFICQDTCCEEVHRTVGNHLTNKVYNDFFAGFSLIREDNGTSRFYTYGGEGSYTYGLCSRGGITGDIGANFGSDQGVNYTKFNVLVGGTYYPIRQAVPASDFSFSLHVLAGINDIKSSYSYSGYSSYSSNITSFTMDVGAGANYYFGHDLGLGLRVGYMPSFGKGSTANNFRVAIGIDLK